MAISDTLGGKKIHKKLGLSFSYISQKSNCYLLISDHTNVWTMVTFCAFFFFFFWEINLLSYHMNSTLSHTCQAISSWSIDVISLDDARQNWNLHGWSPKWLIASLACMLHSQLKITCHLFGGLSPQFPREWHILVCFCFFLNTRLCMCICKYAWAGGVGLWRPLLCSFHLLKKRFSPCFSNNE